MRIAIAGKHSVEEALKLKIALGELGLNPKNSFDDMSAGFFVEILPEDVDSMKALVFEMTGFQVKVSKFF